MSIPTPDPTLSLPALRDLYGLGNGNGNGNGGGGGGNDGSAGGSGFGIHTGVRAKPKIIYSSRTHSQLAKVVSELKHTRYRPKLTILGSRQQLCVHPVVSKLEGAAQTHACRALTTDKACKYYEHLPTWSANNSHLSHAVLDIEDLMVLGREQSMCPYFYSRDRLTDAELVLLPYNYLIDSGIRSRLGLQFDNAALFFDEAHNLEGVCGDSASFDLSEAELAQAIQEVQRCIDMLRDPQGGAEALLAMQSAGGGGGPGVPDLPSLAILKAILLEFEQLLDRQPLPENGDGLTHPGEFIFDLLKQCKIEYANKDMLLQLLEQSVQLLFSERADTSQRRACALDKFATNIKIVFKGGEQGCVANSSYYRVHIHTKDPPAKAAPAAQSRGLFASGASGASSSRSSTSVGRILSYWCFNPGVSMEDLTRVGVRCMILTSGTLSPMESFAHELKVPFPIRLENPHVISREQIWVGVLERGPAAVTLNSGFKSRENADYVTDLGNSIVNFSRVVPDGLLVFFPSYAVMSSCTHAWKQGGPGGRPSIMDNIQAKKAVVLEPRTSGEFAASIADFESKLVDPLYRGAVFFAVCRGKVSEGLDFADRAGRAVIVTGLPYPAYKDPKVRLKRKYLDESPRVPGIKQLTGQEWYNQQAARAINQAIGRVIRHRRDYGAIILADERFAQPSVRAQLSKWIRPFVATFPQFGAFAGGIARFFIQAAKSFPDGAAKSTTSNGEGAQGQGQLITSSGSSSSSSSAARSALAFRQAGMMGRASTPSTAAAMPPAHAFHASRAALAAYSDANNTDEWLTSFHTLQSGLQSTAPTDSLTTASPAYAGAAASLSTAASTASSASAAPAAAASSSVQAPSSLAPPPRPHPTSLLLSILKPAHSQSHKTPASLPAQGSGGGASSATTDAAAARASSRFLRMSCSSPPRSSAAAAGTVAAPIKIELEEEESQGGSFADRLAAASSQQPALSTIHVKQEVIVKREAAVTPAPAVSGGVPSSTTTAADGVKAVIKRIKQSLSVAAFALFKTALARLSTLKATESTTANFMQRSADVRQTVELIVSLLCGFEGNVLADGADAQRHASAGAALPSTADGGDLTRMFASHIPTPFRPQYANAIANMQRRYPLRCQPEAPGSRGSSNVPPPAAAGTNPSVTKGGSTASAAASQSSRTGIKRERSPPPPPDSKETILRAMSSTSAPPASAAAAIPLPCPHTQASFVAAVKASLSQSEYARFRQVIIALESAQTTATAAAAASAPTPSTPTTLLHELRALLRDDALLASYGQLMPQRLRPALQTVLAAKQAAADLKWTAPQAQSALAPMFTAKRSKTNE